MSNRICIVRLNYFPEEAHLRKNIDALVDGGFQVDVLCLREPGAPARGTYRGGDIYRLPLTHKRAGVTRYLFEYVAFFLLVLLKLAWLSVLRRYRTVEVYNLPDFLVLAALPAKLRGARVVLYMFEMMPEQFGHSYRLQGGHALLRPLRWLERLSVRFADRVVAVSPHQKETVARRSQPRTEPVLVVNSPDEQVFSPRRRSRAAKKIFRVMTHGSLLPRYSIDTLIRAVPHLAEAIPELEVWIVGEGEERRRLERLARRLGVQGIVRFPGWVDVSQLADFISRADVAVYSASASWLLPNKLLEYVAIGRPVVAARSEALSFVFGQESLAYFQPSDERELACRVIEIYRNPDRARLLVRNARRDFQPYRWERAREQYLRLHSELAGLNRGNGRCI